MLTRRKVNIAMIAAAAIGGLSSAAVAADEPTIGVIVPTLDSEFWNRYVAFTKWCRATWREAHHPERRQQAG